MKTRYVMYCNALRSEFGVPLGHYFLDICHRVDDFLPVSRIPDVLARIEEARSINRSGAIVDSGSEREARGI